MWIRKSKTKILQVPAERKSESNSTIKAPEERSKAQTGREENEKFLVRFFFCKLSLCFSATKQNGNGELKLKRWRTLRERGRERRRVTDTAKSYRYFQGASATTFIRKEFSYAVMMLFNQLEYRQFDCLMRKPKLAHD